MLRELQAALVPAIDFGAMYSVSLAPSSNFEEIAQNIRTLLLTPKGTVPLDRDFGIDLSLLDMPIDIAKARLTAEMAAAINRYEPRAKLLSADFSQSEPLNGALNVVLKLEISE